MSMSVLQALDEHFTVRRVFGEAYERDGVTIVPVAAIYGGGGGGGDRATESEGLGFGMVARPLGVYVIADGAVRWEPAFDLNRVILGGQLLGLVAIWTVRLVVKRRAKKRA